MYMYLDHGINIYILSFFSPDAVSKNIQTSSESNFWTEFRSRAAETLKVAEQARKLQQMLPGVDAGRFITGDQEYINERIFSFVETAKTRQEEWLPGLLALAHEYYVDTWQVRRLALGDDYLF